MTRTLHCKGRQARREPPQCGITFSRCPQGGAYQGHKGPFGCCKEGRAHEDAAETLAGEPPPTVRTP